MNKVILFLKKAAVWFGTVITLSFAVLFAKEHKANSIYKKCDEEKKDEIDEDKAEKRRQEAIAAVDNIPASTLTENYDTVCDTISDGIERFRRRCKNADN